MFHHILKSVSKDEFPHISHLTCPCHFLLADITATSHAIAQVLWLFIQRLLFHWPNSLRVPVDSTSYFPRDQTWQRRGHAAQV